MDYFIYQRVLVGLGSPRHRWGRHHRVDRRGDLPDQHLRLGGEAAQVVHQTLCVVHGKLTLLPFSRKFNKAVSIKICSAKLDNETIFGSEILIKKLSSNRCLIKIQKTVFISNNIYKSTSAKLELWRPIDESVINRFHYVQGFYIKNKSFKDLIRSLVKG